MNLRRCKSVIRAFFPPIFIEGVLFAKSLCANQRYRWLIKKQAAIDSNTERLFIIGNGPSLNDALQNHLDLLQKSACMCVNMFANTSHFEILKPKYYILADPEYFKKKEDMLSIVSEMMESITRKVNWPMTIVVPLRAYNCCLVNQISRNPHISVHYYNNFYHNSFRESEDALVKRVLFKLWNKGLVAPPAQTVLNTAVFMGIHWRIKEVYVIGADMSWHSDVQVDQETNALYRMDTHFYGNKKMILNYTLSKLLYYTHVALADYELLRQYADYVGVNVYNASAFSYIDVLERKKLKDLSFEE